MKTLTLAVGLLLCLSLPAWAREPTPLDLSKVPQEGKTPRDFVPVGWKIEATTRGDLDKNGKEDLVLELVQEEKKGQGDEFTQRSRALLVLLSQEGGKLRRAGASNQVLYCIGCQGTMGGGGGGVTRIEKGVLIVDQMSGSRDMTHTLLRFRYNAKDRKFVFIGEDVERTDRAVGTSTVESTNLLTGTKITEQRKYDPKTDTEVVVSSKKDKVPVSRRYLENVDISKY